MEAGIDCSGMASQPNFACGLAIFNAGSGMHLLRCDLATRNGATQLEMTGSAGTTLGNKNLTATQGGQTWPQAVQLRLLRNLAAGTWTCQGRAQGDSAIPWAAVTTSITATNPPDNMHEGDAWWGPTVRAWGGSASTYTTAAFDYVSVYVPTPAAPPADVNGFKDQCVAANAWNNTITNVVNGSQNITTFTGLSQNFPYTVSLTSLLSTGDQFTNTEFVPHFYARPMPPHAWALGVWLDPKFTNWGFPSGPSNVYLTTWPDSSGNQHYVSQPIAARRPLWQYGLQGATGAMHFIRNSGTFMVGGADSIDLGVSTEFQSYFLSRPYTSSPQAMNTFSLPILSPLTDVVYFADYHGAGNEC
jgi:hypothetical protein